MSASSLLDNAFLPHALVDDRMVLLLATQLPATFFAGILSFSYSFKRLPTATIGG